MYHDDYGRSWEGPFEFSRTSIDQHAPTATGVYEVLYREGTQLKLAYIGRSTRGTIHDRLKAHVEDFGNWALGRLGDPSKFCFLFYRCDPGTAEQIEETVLATRKPPFNVKVEYRNAIPSIAVH